MQVYCYVQNPLFSFDPLGLTDFTEWLNRGTSTFGNYINGTADNFNYTGVSNDISRRAGEHSGIFNDINALKDAGSLYRNESRCIEEAIIKNAEKGELENIIHSIAPGRYIYDDAVKYGEEWLTKNEPDLAEKLKIKCK